MEHALDFGGGSGSGSGGHDNTSTLLDKPNIFDIIAQQSTKELLYPLLERIFRIIQNKWPNHCHSKFTRKYWEEVYLMCDLIIENISLRRNEAGLCEDYYGIKRENLRHIPSIVELCIIPYIIRRMQRKLEEIRSSTFATRNLVERLIQKIAPVLVLLYEHCNLIFKLLYIFSDSRYHSVICYLAGMRFQRAQPNMTKKGWWLNLAPLATLMFSLRFLQWWREQGVESFIKGDTDTIPPAPTKFNQDNFRSNLNGTAPGKCSICKDYPKQPVALTSGRVFCRFCLENDPLYAGSKKCPVTLEYVRPFTALFIDNITP